MNGATIFTKYLSKDINENICEAQKLGSLLLKRASLSDILDSKHFLGPLQHTLPIR